MFRDSDLPGSNNFQSKKVSWILVLSNQLNINDWRIGRFARHLKLSPIFCIFRLAKTKGMKWIGWGSALALCLIISCKKSAIPGQGTSSGNQPPEISSISPETGSPGIPVEISGMHFDSVAANLIVAFN